jgi:hypothetical protein
LVGSGQDEAVDAIHEFQFMEVDQQPNRNVQVTPVTIGCEWSELDDGIRPSFLFSSLPSV